MRATRDNSDAQAAEPPYTWRCPTPGCGMTSHRRDDLKCRHCACDRPSATEATEAAEPADSPACDCGWLTRVHSTDCAIYKWKHRNCLPGDERTPAPDAASSVLSWHDILAQLCRIYGNSKATDHVSIGHNVTDDEGRFVAQLRLTVGMLREWNGEDADAGHRKAVSRLEELDRSDRKQESAGGPLDVRIDPVLDLRRACNIALECFGDDKGPTARDALADIGDACDRYDKAAEPAGERAEGWHWRCGCLALYHLATLAECPVCHAKRPEAEIIEDGG